MDRKLGRYFVVAALLAVIVLLWRFAWRADHSWFEHHIQKHYVWYTVDERRVFRVWRTMAVVLGGVLLLPVRRLARWGGERGLTGVLGSMARIGAAVLLSLVVVELVLRKVTPPLPPPGAWLPVMPVDVSLEKLDPRLGWTNKASYQETVHVGQRDITYAFDASSNRSPAPDDVLDPTRSTIAFVGESIIEGHGYLYDETIPAEVGRLTGLQVVNLGVPGYANDQSYMRLTDAIDKLPPLAAVVTLFLGPQLERDVTTYRPRLTLDSNGRLQWVPPDHGLWAESRLSVLFRNLIPYHDDSALELAREVFRQTAILARGRGAYPLFVLFSWGPTRPIQEHKEAWLYRELFEDQQLPAIVVDVMKFVEGDGHPTPEESVRLADAVTGALREHLP